MTEAKTPAVALDDAALDHAHGGALTIGAPILVAASLTSVTGASVVITPEKTSLEIAPATVIESDPIVSLP